MKKDLRDVSAVPVTKKHEKRGIEMWLHAQGKTDYVVPAFGVNTRHGEDLVVSTEEGAVYVTKAQVKAFFNLVEAPEPRPRPCFCMYCGQQLKEKGLGILICPDNDCGSAYLPYQNDQGQQCLEHIDLGDD